MSEWSQVNTIEMLVSKVDNYFDINKETDRFEISCNLLNVARGRCEIILFKENSSSKKNNIFISSKKPIMKALKTLSKENFKEISNTFYKYSQFKTKKIKIIVSISQPLAIDSHGILNIEKDLDLKIEDIQLSVPVF